MRNELFERLQAADPEWLKDRYAEILAYYGPGTLADEQARAAEIRKGLGSLPVGFLIGAVSMFALAWDDETEHGIVCSPWGHAVGPLPVAA